MDETRKSGRVTIPTDLDVVPETLEILKKWGADAIRDCDGTDFPQQLKDADAKIYSTYYTTRKDNAWAKANPDEVQQCYICLLYTSVSQKTDAAFQRHEPCTPCKALFFCHAHGCPGDVYKRQ